MSNKVDQRIVEMRFENSQFEKGVSQSISSLDKLKQSLNFDNSVTKSSFDSLSGNLSNLGTSVDRISDRFSNLGVIGMGALMSIGNAAVQVGQSMVQNLLSNITAGYERYNEMMESTQTIMYATRDQWADQGAQMDYITDKIDRLNWYTDETSYNLSDMTNSIGKFVSAGVDLDDAVVDMMGIASWAAISGQNAEKASYAMYNLSQAMAMGKLTNLDWKSIENANMATREFKQTAIDTGIALGTLWEDAEGVAHGFDQYGHDIEVTVDNFRTTLAGGWLDRDVLSEVLKVYGEFANELGHYADVTGIETSKLLEYIDEAVEAGMSDMDVDEANNWLKTFGAKYNLLDENGYFSGQYEALGEMIVNLADDYYELGRSAFKAAQESKTLKDSLDYTADAITTAWMNIFTSIFGNYLESKELWTTFSEVLYEQMVKPVEELGEMFDTLYNIGGFDYLKNALLNFYEEFATIKDAIKEGFDEILPDNLAKKLLYFFEDIFAYSEKIALVDWPWYSDIENIKSAAESLAMVLNRFFINVSTIAKSIKDAWDSIFPKKIDPAADSLTDKIRDIAKWIEDLSSKFVLGSDEADKLTRTFKGVFAILDMIKMAIVAFLKPLGAFNIEIDNMGGSILDATASWGDWVVAWHDWMQETGFFDQVAAKVYEFFGNIPVWADQATMALFGMHLNEFFDTIAGDIGLAIGAIVLFFTDLPENAQKAFEFITGETDFLTWWDKIKEKVQGAWDTLQEFFNNLPQKMDDISEALFGSDWATVWAEIQTGVFNAYQDIAKFFGFIEEYDEKGFKKNSPFKQMLMDLEEMWDELMQKIDELKQKLEPVGDWLIENVFSQEGMEEAGKVLKTAGIIGSISLILFLLWKVFGQLKEIIGFAADIKGSKTSNNGLFGKLSELMGPAKWLRNIADDTEAMAGNFAKLLKGGYFALIGLLVVELAAALMIVSKCMTDNPGQTLAAFGMLLLMFGAIVGTGIYMMRKLPANDMKNMGECFALMGFVFIEIAAALWILQDIPIAQMIASVIALGAFFVAMAFAVGYFAKQPAMEANLMQIAVAFDLMAASIVILAFAMYILKDLNLEQALIALGSIIVLMAALFGFALLIDKFKVGAGLQALSIGFIALGVGILFMGAAMLLAGVGINIAADGISKIVDALVQLGDSMATPQQLGDAFVQFFVGIAQSIGENRESLTQGLTDLWMIFIDTFRNVAPEILANLQMFLLQFLEMLTTIWPNIEQFLLMAGNTALLLLGQLVSGLLDILVANGPKVLEILRFLGQSILILTEEFTPQITTVAFNLLLDTLNQILENIGEITMLATAIGIEIILGLIDGIAEEFDDVIDSGVNLILKLIEGIGQGIEDHAGELRETLESFVEHLKNGLKEFLGLDKGASDGELYKVAVQAVADFLRGIADMGPNIWQAGLDVAKAFISGTQSQEGLDEHSPSKAMEKVGEYAMDGLVNGLDNKTAAVAEGARKAGQTALKGMTKIAADISKRIDDIVNGWTPPTITPVLDLSEVTSGASDLASIFNDQTYGLDLAGATGFEINKSNSNVNSLFDNLTDFMSGQATNNQEALTQNIVFNIDGAKDPKVVADEVSTILQNQIDRRNAVWV